MPDPRTALPCPHTDLDCHVDGTYAGSVIITQICRRCGAARVLFPADKPPKATGWCGERAAVPPQQQREDASERKATSP